MAKIWVLSAMNHSHCTQSEAHGWIWLSQWESCSCEMLSRASCWTLGHHSKISVLSIFKYSQYSQKYPLWKVLCGSFLCAIGTLRSEERYIISSRNITALWIPGRDFYLLGFEGVCNENQEAQKVLFVFQLFIFLAGLLGFWQQLCMLEVAVLLDLQGGRDFMGHYGTAVSPTGEVSSHKAHWVLGKHAASLQVLLFGGKEHSFIEVMLKSGIR